MPGEGMALQRPHTNSAAPVETWILALVARTHSSAGSVDLISWEGQQPGIEVDPARIFPLDEIDLPLADPMLQRFLALDSGLDMENGS